LFFLAVRPAGAAEAPPAENSPAPAPAAVTAMTLTLGECLHLAYERQPRLAAQRASLAAAEEGRKALESLGIAAVLAHEVPVRRKQAGLGVTAAAAGLDVVERETVYAVTRTYFTVLYARAQEAIARGVVGQLSAIHKVAQQALKDGVRNISSTDVDRAAVYLHLAQTKQIQAAQGVQRALAALREAIGLGCDVRLDVPAGPLPEPVQQPRQEEVVAAALDRRGELIQAGVFADVTCLEVEAQGTSRHLRMQTFAAGSDIHAHQIPQGVHNTEYRPGAQPPEMPTLLAGSRAERMEQTRALHARAQALVEETRNLITLEAENAFLRWQEAAGQVPEARQAADAGDKLADALTRDFTSGLKVRVEDAVNARVLAAQARSQYVEYLYLQILALADLERVTAGGFCAGLVEAPVPKEKAAQKEGDGGK
jgi:outer membrane protein TolC